MAAKTVLVTGCSDNGIGSALGKVLQERGYHVFATARNVSKMKWLEGLDRVTPIQLDITKPADIKAAIETVSKTHGKLDHLINNAGRNHFMPVLDVEVDTVRTLFEINYFGQLAVTQAFAPLLVKVRKSFEINAADKLIYEAGKRTSHIHHINLRLRQYTMDGHVSLLLYISVF